MVGTRNPLTNSSVARRNAWQENGSHRHNPSRKAIVTPQTDAAIVPMRRYRDRKARREKRLPEQIVGPNREMRTVVAPNHRQHTQVWAGVVYLRRRVTLISA